MRRTLPALLASALALSLPLSAYAEELVILHTNDIHDHLESYPSKDGKDIGGLDRLSRFVLEEKARHPNTLVLDGGDVFQGTPLYTFFKGEVDMKAMATVGYDAGVLGNHDLDDGWSNLRKQLAVGGYPVLCANVTNADGTPAFLPAMTFVRGHTRIGVIGLIGDGAWGVVAPKSRQGLKELPIAETAKKWVAALRPQVDLVMVLSHNGFVEDQELAKAVPGIDVIVGGHSHTPVPQPKFVANGNANGIGGTIVLQAGCYSQYAGRLMLDVDKSRIKSYSGQLVALEGGMSAVSGIVAPYAGQVKAQMAEVLGECPTGLNAAGKYAGESPLGSWLADMVKEAGNGEIGILNSGGIRAELPAGKVTVGKVFEILPFENYIVGFECPGADVQKLIEATVERLHAHKPGTMQVSGLSFKARQGKLVGPILVNGKPLDPAKTYRVSTIDYLLGGSEGAFFEHRAREAKGTLLRDQMIARVRQLKTLGLPTTGRITVEE